MVTLMVTSRSLVCVSTVNGATPSSNTLMWHKKLKEVHSVVDLEQESFVVTTHFQISKSKMRSTKMDQFVQDFTFVASSKDARDEWLIIFDNLFNNIWQPQVTQKMRLTISLNYYTCIIFQYVDIRTHPEVYQFHIFATKVNRKGRNQIRCLAFSNERIYNISAPEDYPLNPGKVKVVILSFLLNSKWSFKVSTLKKVKSDSCQLTLFNSMPKAKQEVSYIFKDIDEKERV